jgi:hypothetical protein
MAGIYPDSGVPAQEARNSVDVPTVPGCAELFHSTSRCAPRFDPAAANAVMSELLNLINKGEVTYNCALLDQVQLATRYLIQRGLPTGAILYGGPFDYTCNLDPPLTRHNDYLTLVVVPIANNQAAVRINVDSRGLVPLLRNDGQQLQGLDLRAGVPTVISYFGGNWFHVGLCSSQVPIIVQGAVDIWIRTDGNDNTGDGSANTPDKAFRTIQGAWGKVGSRYAATPLFTMNFRLGVPGTYAGAIIGPFGGNASLSSLTPATDKANYRLSSIDIGNNTSSNLWLRGMNITLRGLTFVRDVAPPSVPSVVRADGGAVLLENCDFDSTSDNPNGEFITILNAAAFGVMAATYVFEGRGLRIGSIINSSGAGNFAGCYQNLGATFSFNNLPAGYHLSATGLGSIKWTFSNIYSTGCTGPQYLVTENSIINMGGQACPGSLPGVTQSGGQFIP